MGTTSLQGTKAVYPKCPYLGGSAVYQKCFILCVVCDLQIDEDMTAKLDLCHTRFSFMENELVYVPNWMAPEGLLPLLTLQLSRVIYTSFVSEYST